MGEVRLRWPISAESARVSLANSKVEPRTPCEWTRSIRCWQCLIITWKPSQIVRSMREAAAAAAIYARRLSEIFMIRAFAFLRGSSFELRHSPRSGARE